MPWPWEIPVLPRLLQWPLKMLFSWPLLWLHWQYQPSSQRPSDFAWPSPWPVVAAARAEKCGTAGAAWHHECHHPDFFIQSYQFNRPTDCSYEGPALGPALIRLLVHQRLEQQAQCRLDPFGNASDRWQSAQGRQHTHALLSSLTLGALTPVPAVPNVLQAECVADGIPLILSFGVCHRL